MNHHVKTLTGWLLVASAVIFGAACAAWICLLMAHCFAAVLP